MTNGYAKPVLVTTGGLVRVLLGYESVRNYDGSWTEWANLVDVPIERGA